MLQFGTDLAAGVARRMAEFAIRLPTGLHSGFSVGVYSLSLRLTQGALKAVRLFTQQLGKGGGDRGHQGKSTHRWACMPHVLDESTESL